MLELTKHKQLFQLIGFREDFKIYSIYSLVKFDPSLWPHPPPSDHDLNNIESTIPKDASTQITAFLAK